MKKILVGVVAVAALAIGAFSLAAAPTVKRITNITTTQAGNQFLPVGYNTLTCDGWVHYKMVTTNSATVATTDPMVKGNTKVPSKPIYINVSAGTQYLALLLDNGAPATCSVTQGSADNTTGSFTTLAASGATTLSSTLDVSGVTTVNAAATLGGTVDAGSLNVAGQLTVTGLQSLVGATNAAGGLTVQGATKLGLADAGSLAVTGTLNNAGDNIAAGGTKTAACVALNNASPSIATATVNTGARCVCSNASTQTNPVKCAVSSTTLTITGPNTTTDNVCYFCIQ